MVGIMNVTYPVSQSGRTSASERLDGWKSIAAYLNRDRTTVIRWTRERGLPVHRLPGGRTGTVYALKHELDRWLGLPAAQAETLAAPTPAPASAASPMAPAAPPLRTARSAQGRWLLAVGALGLAIGIPSLIATRGTAAADPLQAVAPLPLLPADAATAAKFLEARDLVAQRQAAGLERAVVILNDVVRSAPDYALGHVSLAEALLLSREFGALSDADAFAQAKLAARSALKLAPELAAGHRMLGFIAYWGDRDFAKADAHLRRALELDRSDADSHFWYGNILSDHGDHGAGLKALNQARLLQPGSVAIATDLAWAHWAAGQEAAAKAALDRIIMDHPEFAVAYDCRAIIALAEKDYTGYIRNFARFAALRQDPVLIENARRLDDAMRQGISNGRNEIMRQALAQTARDGSRNHVWPALIASVEGNREQLLSILLAAEARNERWEDAGLRLHIERAWPHDRTILAALARRTPQPELPS
jgi:tetratricopeptide (TPR) repeat protein